MSTPPPRWIGRWLLAVAALHVALGLAGAGARLGALATRGWGALAGAPVEERLAVWFVAAGLFLGVAGCVADAAEAQRARLGAAGGVLLLGIAVAGGVLAPRSGFWLLVPPAVAWLRRAGVRSTPQ